VCWALGTVTEVSNTTGQDDKVSKGGRLNFGLGITMYLGN